MMNPEVKELWVKDLLDPANKQGQKFLRSATGDCCLGRLCELYQRETGKGHWTGEGGYSTAQIFFDDEGDESNVALPRGVMAWAGLVSDNPMIDLPVGNDPYQTSMTEA